MECAHLQAHASPDLGSRLAADPAVAPGPHSCAECSSSKQNWLCLACGAVSCGRYVNGHARRHAEQADHQLCMSCDLYSVYCYQCDDYVSNDTDDQLIDNIRRHVMKLSSGVRVDGEADEAAEGGGAGGGGRSGSSSPPHLDDNSPARSLSSSSGDREHERSAKGAGGEEPGRALRPRCRKRSHSDDSTSASAEGATYARGAHKERRTSNGRKEKKVVGLKNLGNTCFMNAVLQSLSNIREFSCYFSSLPSLEARGDGRKVYRSRSYTRQEVHDLMMAEELRKVLIDLSGGASKGAISPECLFLVIWKVVPRFRGYQQQDAHEFLRYMLDRLHTELLQLLPAEVVGAAGAAGACCVRAPRGRASIVTSVFGGTLQSEVRCLACGAESKKHDPFLDLSLDLPESGRHEAPLALADCLASFVQVEELADTERYFCSSCESKQKSTKQFWIRRLPNVLCLHLKRFRWNNFFRTKVDTSISFPVDALDMSRFLLAGPPPPETRRSVGGGGGGGGGGHLYDLAAVIVHHGTGAGSGHYTAFAINGAQWFHFNDQTVRPIDPQTVLACKPYILFYIRRELAPPPRARLDAAPPLS